MPGPDTPGASVIRALLLMYMLLLAVVLLFPSGDLPSGAVEIITDLTHALWADHELVTSERVEVV